MPHYVKRGGRTSRPIYCNRGEAGIDTEIANITCYMFNREKRGTRNCNIALSIHSKGNIE